jgi:hypothetical protein
MYLEGDAADQLDLARSVPVMLSRSSRTFSSTLDSIGIVWRAFHHADARVCTGPRISSRVAVSFINPGI